MNTEAPTATSPATPTTAPDRCRRPLAVDRAGARSRRANRRLLPLTSPKPRPAPASLGIS